ncbi:uncharacterized protein LOC110455993 [Mizuhopecten yessoensis]|uniref:Uncharacterized protein n=1 Tax=Mizuhopecten yessoensis TaxID=6573 RepID=A0A210QBX0_MIZYE|nr:uncharacterized protein LOC110455993 [Mizuhopecten yessoensis]OWF46236.1 hypothetical protein KP79_PYT15459 [Mizuhopecten yessoensis]
MELDQETPAPITNGGTASKQENSEPTNVEKETESPSETQTETLLETQTEPASEEKMETEENEEPPLEEQPNTTFTIYSQEEMNAFMLRLDDVDNPEMKDAAVSLMHEAKFPSMEMHKVAVMENFRPKEVTLVFDHQKELVKIGDRTIKSRRIRFACLNRIENTTFGYEVVLSFLTKEKKIRVLHFLNPDNAMSLVASLNSFRRLTYTLCKDILATADEFGKALRQSSPIFTGSLKNVSIYNLETKTYESQNDCMYVYLDTACLMILPSQFWEDSPYQMYFWKEAVTGSVDRIMVLHEKGTLHVETQKFRLEIPQYNEDPAKSFFECIRGLKPVPQGSFTDLVGRLKKIQNPDTPVPVKSPADGGIGARAINAPARSGSQPTTGELQQPYYYDNRTDTDNIRLKSFLDDLRSAVTRFENQDEIALPWVIAEDEIRRMLDEGFVPETDIMSGGLNPNNLDHFMKCEEEIEHQLVQQQYDRALSRLQGTKQVFMESDLLEMKILLRIDDITLLKQMYFHSFA